MRLSTSPRLRKDYVSACEEVPTAAALRRAAVGYRILRGGQSAPDRQNGQVLLIVEIVLLVLGVGQRNWV
jgi:hypothetical protein